MFYKLKCAKCAKCFVLRQASLHVVEVIEVERTKNKFGDVERALGTVFYQV